MSYNDFVFSLFCVWLFCLSPPSLPGCDIAWWPLNSPYGAGTTEPIEQITQSRCFSDDCVAPWDFNANLCFCPDRRTNFIWCAWDEDVLLKTEPIAVVLIWTGTSCHICTLLIWHPGRWGFHLWCERYLMMLKCDNSYKMPVHNVITSHWRKMKMLRLQSPFSEPFCCRPELRQN